MYDVTDASCGWSSSCLRKVSVYYDHIAYGAICLCEEHKTMIHDRQFRWKQITKKEFEELKTIRMVLDT